jgi:hypothetical protein
MPSLHQHLERFKPILDAKIQEWGENRPWWTIHRGRPRIGAAEGNHDRWAGYALTSRWGEIHNLTVGLAPRRSVPQSSLHALIPTADANAAYVAALFNSTPIQTLADALGPGQLRMDELLELHVPLFEEPDRSAITNAGYELADLVTEMVRDLSARWPRLPDALRGDPALSGFVADAWTPRQLPPARSGALKNVGWVAELIPARATQHPIRDVTVEQTLFGTEVVAIGDGSRRQAFRLTDDQDDIREALTIVLRGAQAAGASLRDLADVQIAVDADGLVSALAQDRAVLEAKLARYHALREDVDQRVEAHLAG